MKKYIPNGPYVFKSGKRTGQALEVLMFQDYDFLQWFYGRLERELKNGGKKNVLHLHLEWLLNKGETRKSIIPCPVCKKNMVDRFFVRRSQEGISTNTSYASCKNEDCIDHIKGISMGIVPEIYILKFSSLSLFRKKDEKRMVSEIYKKAFLVSGKLNRQRAFDFFIE